MIVSRVPPPVPPLFGEISVTVGEMLALYRNEAAVSNPFSKTFNSQFVSPILFELSGT